jgi:nicotinamidase-related amidase
MYTLCIIDMQEWFGVNPSSMVANNVEREIYQAMHDGATILFVEYQDCGNTIDRLTQIVRDSAYTKHHSITKKYDDGSKEIITAINNKKLPIKHLKVVGVNTDCCVLHTVSGLKSELKSTKIEVVADACSSSWSSDSHEKGLDSIRSIGCIISNYNPAITPPST